MALFNQAVGWLRRNRVLLPGVSVLAKQVASVRQVAEKRLYATVMIVRRHRARLDQPPQHPTRGRRHGTAS